MSKRLKRNLVIFALAVLAVWLCTRCYARHVRESTAAAAVRKADNE